ncbi:hypothetical protein BT93_A0866 [Corymbia citriodora subsp. variegata]|nr:hypothetical protein BT93_A0866 [Corymbia citriodora subsp. variegata]
MSWIRTAVNRAVEVGGRNNLTRTVRSYADSVVHQAGNVVAEGAKLLQDRIGGRSLQSFEQAAKRLEEMSVSCRGLERILLLRRWLVSLKEAERESAGLSGNDHQVIENSSDESKDSPSRQTLVNSHDPDLGGEPLNFHYVFLHSQALEGIIMSMILEAPTQEEVSLLLEIFGLCLTGGVEVHKAVLSSIQDLANAFSGYLEEVLVKREELLQYAQAAISGLKLNADVIRIDSKTFSLKEKLNKISSLQQPSDKDHDKLSQETIVVTKEDMEEVRLQIQLFSMMESLLLRKKSLRNGDTSHLHVEKVDKLKVLSESLTNSSSKAEKRISDHRSHKEEAVNFRVAKTTEMTQLEKELEVEIEELEKQKETLEKELKKVNGSLTGARLHLHNAREEREQFDEASNQILLHLKSKEDELSRSVLSYRMEADVVNMWIGFLENTWTLQTSYIEDKEKQVNGELERYGDYFVNLVVQLLSAYEEGLGLSLASIKETVAYLGQSPRSEKRPSMNEQDPKEDKSKRRYEEEYLDLESKFLTALSTVEAIKRQFYIQPEDTFRKDHEKVEKLFAALEKIKDEFDSIQRPDLEIETPIQKSQNPLTNGHPITPSSVSGKASQNSRKGEVTDGSSNKVEKTSSPNSEPGKLEFDYEKAHRDHLTDESGDWDFDELEKEFRAIL